MSVTLAPGMAKAVVGTFFSHYFNKRSKKKAAKDAGEDDPTALDLRYDEGTKVIKAFLEHASKHTLEELQGFTAMHVPCPTWVRKEVVEIPYQGCIDRAEQLLEKQLESYGPNSMERVGGRNWWKVRGRELEGEWIEMKRDYLKRKASEELNPTEAAKTERVMLYIHGGAYFFSSLDTHRYQVQRHARKLGGRAFSPSYRLAPQYPFPCGLLDCLAAYLYLIQPPPTAPHKAIHPSCIVLAGDSAGGGCILSMLVLIRDLGLPMPAGADLLSPWVDLSHSFPSILKNAKTDFIPGEGFHYKPSLAWPPVRGTVLSVESDVPGESAVEIDEQIQLYCPNILLSHPLVSPINQGSLGGLCPILVHSGGGELLRDEQIYLAHKLADPQRYTPSDAVLQDYPALADQFDKYRPTRVQLQVFDGCAHVVPTLSITEPAKYMYRSAANFNIWALQTAQAKAARRPQASRIPTGLSAAGSDAGSANGHQLTREALAEKLHEYVNNRPVADDDVQSERSTSSSSTGTPASTPGVAAGTQSAGPTNEKITVMGALPSFGPDHIIRQRVSFKGKIRPMEPREQVEALNLPRNHVGRVHIEGPIKKWQEKRTQVEAKYAKHLTKWREVKAKDYELAQANGFLTRKLHGENPPQCSVASWYDPELAREAAKSVDEPSTKTKAVVMMYMRMSQKPDEEQVGNVTDASPEALQRERTRQEEARAV